MADTAARKTDDSPRVSEMLTVEEAAEISRVSASQLYKAVRGPNWDGSKAPGGLYRQAETDPPRHARILASRDRKCEYGEMTRPGTEQ